MMEIQKFLICLLDIAIHQLGNISYKGNQRYNIIHLNPAL